jgi:6-pyruvoyltetrahydropterin/6-carboxytetrahydropterin synthase
VVKEFTIDAAHWLPNHEGACSTLHGHTYRVRVTYRASVLQPDGPACGMVIDFGDLKQAWQAVHEQLDHRCINDKIENPTAENMARFIFNEMEQRLPGVARVDVWETPTSRASYFRQ